MTGMAYVYQWYATVNLAFFDGLIINLIKKDLLTFNTIITQYGNTV